MASSETRIPGSRRAISFHFPSTLRTPIIHHPLGSGGGCLPPRAWLYQLQTSLDLRGHSSRPRGGGPLRGIKTPTPPLPAPTRAGFQELGDRGKQRVKVARTERGNKRRRPRSPTVRGPASPPSPRGVTGARAAALLASRGPPPPPPAHLTCDTELAGTGIRL